MRPNRKSVDVAKWVLEAARKRHDDEYEVANSWRAKQGGKDT